MKCADMTWEFRSADTKKYSHCYHAYPAMMIPQIVRRLLTMYGKNAKLLFDPYCGTGTSLVEATIAGIDSIGTEINPLARLIAKVKSHAFSLQKIDVFIKDYCDYTFTYRFGISRSHVVLPKFQNIDFWFKKDTQEFLAVIKSYIDAIDDPDAADFFKVAFSETVRESSLTSQGEFKLLRIKENKMQTFNPDVLAIMERKLARNRNGLAEYRKVRQKNTAVRICDWNSVIEIPADDIQDRTVDIVITSPPYGDSRTTVAYGQYSRLQNQWLGFENAANVDNSLMGGKRAKEITVFGCPSLDLVIDRIANSDAKRAKDVVAFYCDYKKSIDNVAAKIKRGGAACYVVGNRRVKGMELPTDEATAFFFEKNGFLHCDTFVRGIPNKRMPLKNSPTNVTGLTDATMTNEYIVIMKKCG